MIYFLPAELGWECANKAFRRWTFLRQKLLILYNCASCLTLGTPQTILCSTAHTRLGKIRVPPFPTSTLPPRNKVLHVCRLLFNHTIINDSIIHLLFIQDFWERLSQIKCKPSMLFSSSFSFRCSRVCCIPFSRDQPHSRGCVLECFLLVWLLSLLVFCR